MSNRDDLNAARAQLRDADQPLKAVQEAAPSISAAVQIGRARAMIRGAEQLLAAALQHRVDAPAPAGAAEPRGIAL
jgi:hypothetical protein